MFQNIKTRFASKLAPVFAEWYIFGGWNSIYLSKTGRVIAFEWVTEVKMYLTGHVERVVLCTVTIARHNKQTAVDFKKVQTLKSVKCKWGAGAIQFWTTECLCTHLQTSDRKAGTPAVKMISMVLSDSASTLQSQMSPIHAEYLTKSIKR